MHLKGEEGTSAVEFAIIVSLFLVLVFGIVELSLALFDKAVITNASREGARKGILYRPPSAAQIAAGMDVDFFPETGADSVEDHVLSYLQNRLISFSSTPTAVVEADPGVDYVDNDGDGLLTRGDTRIVRVIFTYEFLVLPGFINALAGGINLSAETRMRME